MQSLRTELKAIAILVFLLNKTQALSDIGMGMLTFQSKKTVVPSILLFKIPPDEQEDESKIHISLMILSKI